VEIPIVKFFSEAERAALTKRLGIEEGDLILFAAEQWLTACEILGRIRLYCAEVMKGQGKLTVPPASSISFGSWIPAAEFRQGEQPLVFKPSSVHRPSGGGHSAAEDRP